MQNESLRKVFTIIVILLLLFVANVFASSVSITQSGTGVNSGSVGNETSEWENGLKITIGTEIKYRFNIPETDLPGGLTNLRVSIYGKGKDWAGEPDLYAGGDKLCNLPESEGEHGPYSIPLSYLEEAEGTIPGNWLDITLSFGSLDVYDINYIKVEYDVPGFDQAALEQYQSILISTQAIYNFYDNVTSKWPLPLKSTDGIVGTVRAIIPGYTDAIASINPLIGFVKSFYGLAKLHKGLINTFDDYFDFTNSVISTFDNKGNMAYGGMENLATVWRNAISDNGQIDSDEISGINEAISEASQRIDDLEGQILNIGDDLKSKLDVNTDEGIRNCLKTGFMFISPMVRYSCDVGEIEAGGYISSYGQSDNLSPLVRFLEDLRPTQSTYALSLIKTGNGKVKVNNTTCSLPWSGNFTSDSNISIEALPDSGWEFNNWSGNSQEYTEPAGGWVWASGDSSSYRNWISGEPSNSSGIEHHAEINHSGHTAGKWNDEPRSTLQYAIIEKETYSTGWKHCSANGHYYKLTSKEMSWFNAEAEAKSLGGYLATIRNHTENDWIKNNFTQPNLWIGLCQLQYSTKQTILMDDHKSITANFSRPSYNLEIDKTAGNGNILVNGTLYSLPYSGTFVSGSSITLEAVPDSCWDFLNWSGDLTGSASVETFTIDGYKNIKALFMKPLHQLSISKTGNGSVAVNNQIVSLPFNCDIAECDEVTIEALADNWGEFTGWTGDITESTNPLTLNISSEINVTANFIQTGSLQIDITPEKVIEKGTWQLYGNEYSSGWQPFNQVFSGIPVGSYTLAFGDVAGYAEPEGRSVEISEGTNTLSETYFEIFSAGTGTENDPFVIASADDLLDMGSNPASWAENYCFILKKDIYLSEYVFDNPVINHFQGKFNGNGHKIIDLTIRNAADLLGGGLFRLVSGQIYDLGLEDAMVDGEILLGSLAGTNQGTISRCYAVTTVNGHADVGGLVGVNWLQGSIIDSYVSGLVDGNIAGGLVADNYGTVLNCYSVTDVIGSEVAGGLVGTNRSNSNVSGCFWNAEIQSYDVINNFGVNESDTTENDTGLTTDQMQSQNTYINAGWDFANTWRICDGTNYPKLIWQKEIAGDFICPDGVDFRDYAILASEWMSEKSFYDIAPPVGGDGIVKFSDWAVFASNWDGNMDRLSEFTSQWLVTSASCDIAPEPDGDRIVDMLDLFVLAENWLTEE